MAVYDHQEREQLEDLKAWWAQWGGYIVAAVSAAALVLIAVTAWRFWQDQRAAGASELYFAVYDATQAKNTEEVKTAMTQLAADYESTGYAPRGALLAARAFWDAQKPEEAQAQLRWAADHAKEKAIAEIARYRLAETMVELKQYDDALKEIAVPHDATYNMLFNDLKGDALMGKGMAHEAAEAWALALTQLISPDSPYRFIIETKLDAALAASSTSPEPAPAATPAP